MKYIFEYVAYNKDIQAGTKMALIVKLTTNQHSFRYCHGEDRLYWDMDFPQKIERDVR